MGLKVGDKITATLTGVVEHVAKNSLSMTNMKPCADLVWVSPMRTDQLTSIALRTYAVLFIFLLPFFFLSNLGVP